MKQILCIACSFLFHNIALGEETELGALDVYSATSGVKMAVDGEPIGELPLLNEKLEAGRYTLSVIDPCYIGKDLRFRISPGEVTKIWDYPFEEKRTGIEISVVDKEGKAQKARVYVDDKDLGSAPIYGELPLCSKEVRVEVKGETLTQSLHLVENKRTKVEIIWDGKLSTQTINPEIDKYTQECQAGSAKSCASLGYRYDVGKGIEKDDEKAVLYYI